MSHFYVLKQRGATYAKASLFSLIFKITDETFFQQRLLWYIKNTYYLNVGINLFLNTVRLKESDGPLCSIKTL